MAAPSLHRSMETFRRSGSSGMVWEDRFISEDLSHAKNKEQGEEFGELRASRGVGTAGQMDRGGGPYRTGKVSPAVDPPSPKLSGCGFCGIFGNSNANKARRRRR